MTARYGAGDPGYVEDVWPLWAIVAVELWMQQVVEANSIEEEVPWVTTTVA